MSGAVEQAQLISDLPHTETNLLRIRFAARVGKTQLQRIQVLLAVSVRPPKARILYIELRKFRRGQPYRTFAGDNNNFFADERLTERSAQSSLDRRVRQILQRHGDLDVGPA